MLELSTDDFMLVKCMVGTTGIIDKDKLVTLRNFQEIKQALQSDDELNDDIITSILNETLYFTDCFNLLHSSNDCVSKHEGHRWGSNIDENCIIFIRLFQDLTESEFTDVLKHCLDETLESFRSLKVDFDRLEARIFRPKLANWLMSHHKELADKYEIIQGPKVTMPVPSQSQGFLFIINNEHFSKKEDRRLGTAKDENNIKDTFSNLGFEIKIENNVNLVNMKTVIKEVKDAFTKLHRKFIVFVLSHGAEKGIKTSDDESFLYKDIISPFQDIKHLELRKRPKIFFFVCCHGDKIDKGMKVHYDGCNDSDAIDVGSAKEHEEDYGNVAYDNPIEVGEEMMPECGETFVGHASYKKYRSYRHTVNGTFFVKSFCQIVRDDPKRNIVDIYQDVQEDVRKTTYMVTKSFQVPVSKSSLTRRCFLVED